MENKTKNETMPVINQVFKDAALQYLAECGLPESLIDGVDCSTYENMEKTLAEVKDCFYSSIKRHIEETYGVKTEKPEALLRRMKYQESNQCEMFRGMDCDPENNKYIANLHSIIDMERQIGESSEEFKRLEQKESLLIKILETGINEEDADKLQEYLEIEGLMRWWIQKEGFVCGFRTAYHLLEECRA